MRTLPRSVPLLVNATLPDGSRVDVEIENGVVAAIRPAGNSSPRTGSLDLTGFLLLTAPAEPHAHLDRGLPEDQTATLRAVTDDHDDATTAQIAARARAAALVMLQNGTTAIRSHVDLADDADPLRGVRALVEVRDSLVDLIDLQVVALVGAGTDDQTVDAAVDLGADLIGGAPHRAADPGTELRRLVRIAKRRRVGLDLHTDESPEGPPTLPDFARLVRGWSGTVTAGHCARLGTLDEDDLTQVLTEVLASDMGIVVIPGRDTPSEGAAPGTPPLRALLDRGIRVAAGADDLRRDGGSARRADALHTASLLVGLGALTIDEAYTAVSSGARSVLGLPLAGVSVGEKAEFLAIRADDLTDALAGASASAGTSPSASTFPSAERIVIHRGRVVTERADTGRGVGGGGSTALGGSMALDGSTGLGADGPRTGGAAVPLLRAG